MTTETDLLPCPFCGLDVTDNEGCFPLNREGTRWEVRCGNPSCFAYDPCDESVQAAVARWNRRATTARDAEVEALRAELGCLQQQYDERTACVIVHRGSALACSDAMRAAYSDEHRRAERLAEAINAYKSECDNPAKDYVLRAKRRDEMFALLRDQEE